MEDDIKRRQFRKADSLESERLICALLPAFLKKRGFDSVNDLRYRNQQTIVARSPEGDQLTMRVRLCWRRGSGRDSNRVRTYSGAAPKFCPKVKNIQFIEVPGPNFQAFYRAKWNQCQLRPWGKLPKIHLLQELVQTWKAPRKNEADLIHFESVSVCGKE